MDLTRARTATWGVVETKFGFLRLVRPSPHALIDSCACLHRTLQRINSYEFVPVLDDSPEIRRVVYSTNAIKASTRASAGHQSQGHFPNAFAITFKGRISPRMTHDADARYTLSRPYRKWAKLCSGPGSTLARSMMSGAGVYVFGKPGKRTNAVRRAVERACGEAVPLERAEAMVCADNPKLEELQQLLQQRPELRWVQFPGAGIEGFRTMLDDERVWTCAKGSFATPVAEHALGLALMGMRGGLRYARTSTWSAQQGTNLVGAAVTILGGGGIASELARLLGPFKADITVVRRRDVGMHGVRHVVPPSQLHAALEPADVVFVALALTPETERIIDEVALAAMRPTAWLVNVARGQHVDTSALVAALRRGEIAGAALDVTDPEPLPDGHPLWDLPNVVITPHTGNTKEMNLPLYLKRVERNVVRFGAGKEPIGVVHPQLGY